MGSAPSRRAIPFETPFLAATSRRGRCQVSGTERSGKRIRVKRSTSDAGDAGPGDGRKLDGRASRGRRDDAIAPLSADALMGQLPEIGSSPQSVREHIAALSRLTAAGLIDPRVCDSLVKAARVALSAAIEEHDRGIVDRLEAMLREAQALAAGSPATGGLGGPGDGR